MLSSRLISGWVISICLSISFAWVCSSVKYSWPCSATSDRRPTECSLLWNANTSRQSISIATWCHDKRCTNKALANYRSANNRRLTIERYRLIQKKLILMSYLCYLFRLRLSSMDSYLLQGLQSADKTKMHPKAKLQNAPTFTGKGSHSHVCFLLVINKTCTYQLCKWQSADTNGLIS